MPIEIQGANAGEIVMDAAEHRLNAIDRVFEFALKFPQGQIVQNKVFINGAELVPKPPEPVAPAPVEAHEKDVFIDDMIVSVPAWARFVTQNTRGTIEAWERRPLNIGKNYANTGGLHKTILKVAEYEQILKAV